MLRVLIAILSTILPRVAVAADKPRAPQTDDGSSSVLRRGFPCRYLELQAPHYRVTWARAMAERELRQPTAEEIKAATSPFLVVAYSHTKPYVGTGGWRCTHSAPPIKAVMRVGDERIEADMTVSQRTWTNPMGAQWNTYDGTAAFPLEQAMALVSKVDRKLQVAVAFRGADPFVFEFRAKDLGLLTPP